MGEIPHCKSPQTKQMGPGFSCLNPQQVTLKTVFFFYPKTPLYWGMPERPGIRGELGVTQGWAFMEQHRHYSLHTIAFLCPCGLLHTCQCAGYSSAQGCHFLAQKCATDLHSQFWIVPKWWEKRDKNSEELNTFKAHFSPITEAFSTVCLSVSKLLFRSPSKLQF